MALVVCTWGGSINASNTVSSPVEIWSNSLSLSAPDAVDLDGLLALVRTPLVDWFEGNDTAIDATVSLDWMKVNEFNVVTGRQITDPTVEYLFPTPPRGYDALDYNAPMGTSYRVSLDNNTRNRRTKGGFFVPRTSLQVQHNGRFRTASVTAVAGAARDFMEALNLITGIQVGIWSRRDSSVTAVTRVRVGDVPDNISRRRDALDEAYTAYTL